MFCAFYSKVARATNIPLHFLPSDYHLRAITDRYRVFYFLDRSRPFNNNIINYVESTKSRIPSKLEQRAGGKMVFRSSTYTLLDNL